MSLGYIIMIVFLVLGYFAGLVFFKGISKLKFLGLLPLLAGVYWAFSDPEKFMPESGRVWQVIILLLAAALWPLILNTAKRDQIK